MKSVLIGNGVNIHFAGKAYSSEFIMRRIMFNAGVNRYDPLFADTLSGSDIEGIFNGFVDTANEIHDGKYDTLGDADDQAAIKDFKNRYTSPFRKYYDIMLEDWFLLIRVFFLTNADLIDQWSTSKQGFERMILDAIYNEGDLQDVYRSMNKRVKRFISSFDNIITLNYDNNLESLTGRSVIHMHGDYSVLADSENPETVNGYIRTQAGKSVVIDAFRHCFCNALLDYSGELKFKHASDIMKGADEMRRWLELSRRNQAEFEKQMAQLKDKNEFVWQLVDTYVRNPALRLGTDYQFDAFLKLEGELHIIGLSPNNDSHIFRCINESRIENVYFYYFSEKDKVIPAVTKPYELRKVQDLWALLDAQSKIYRCSYSIPSGPEVDKLLQAFNLISFDPIENGRIIDEVNSIPQFEANRLCEMVRKELMGQKLRGNPKSEEEQIKDFKEVSRIGLREGVYPSALLLLYIMNHSK